MTSKILNENNFVLTFFDTNNTSPSVYKMLNKQKNIFLYRVVQENPAQIEIVLVNIFLRIGEGETVTFYRRN